MNHPPQSPELLADSEPQLRRSALFVPGDNPRALARAPSLPADVLIYDLEDAVAPEAKDAARQSVIQALAQAHESGQGRIEYVVRINGEDTPWWRDDLVIAATADGVLLPKVESADALQRTATALSDLGIKAAPLWVMLETPSGIMAAGEIAAAGAAVLVMGTSDLGRALRVAPTPERAGLQLALQQCVLAARVHGIDALDGVHLNLHDEAGLRAVCAQGRALGFDGKTLIHPAQIEAANTCFAPTTAECEASIRLLESWQQARSEGRSVAVCDGQLVEALHAMEAQRLLALARHAAMHSPPTASPQASP